MRAPRPAAAQRSSSFGDTFAGSAIFTASVRAAALARVDRPRGRVLLLGVLDHLVPLREPAGRAADREEHGEVGRVEAHRLVDEPGVEVDVRVEVALDEVLLAERDALHLD